MDTMNNETKRKESQTQQHKALVINVVRTPRIESEGRAGCDENKD
jgi:hypothetical protein